MEPRKSNVTELAQIVKCMPMLSGIATPDQTDLDGIRFNDDPIDGGQS